MAKRRMTGAGSSWAEDMSAPPHTTSQVEAQIRNHIRGGGALPDGVVELPPHVVRQLQSQAPPGLRSQCPQQ